MFTPRRLSWHRPLSCQNQAHPSDPAPTLALSSPAPDQATVLPLGSMAAAMQLPTASAVSLMAFPACAPATPLPSEHTPSAADVTPLSAHGLSAQRQGTPLGATAAHEALTDAFPGVSEAAATSSGMGAFSEWAAPSETGMLVAAASSDPRKDTEADVIADTQTPKGELISASSGNTAADSATALDGRGSEQGINWDALDFCFADDLPEGALPQALPVAPPDSAQRGLGTPVESTAAALLAGPMTDAGVEHSVPTGAACQIKAPEEVTAEAGAAWLGSAQPDCSQSAEQQVDDDADEWGEFEELPAPENSAGVSAETTEARHQDNAWSAEATESSNAAVDWPAEPVTGPDHELVQIPILPALGLSSGVPFSSSAPHQDIAPMMWTAESAIEGTHTSGTDELAMPPDVAAPQPSAGVPSAADWDLLESGGRGGSSATGAECTAPNQAQETEAAGKYTVCFNTAIQSLWLL